MLPKKVDVTKGLHCMPQLSPWCFARRWPKTNCAAGPMSWAISVTGARWMTGHRFSVRNMIYNNALMVFFFCIVLLIYWRGIRNNVRWTLNGGWMLVECWVNEWCVQPSFENTIFGDLITSGWLATPHTNRNRRCPIDFPLPCLIWKALYLKILEENRLFQSLYHLDH